MPHNINISKDHVQMNHTLLLRPTKVLFSSSSCPPDIVGGISLQVVGYDIYTVRATVREKSAKCLLEALFLIGFPL